MRHNKHSHIWHTLLLLCHVMSVCVLGKIIPSQGPAPSTCQISRDPVYGGNLVNCSSLGVRELPVDRLPDNVTTLLLQDNEITTLSNNFFLVPQLTSLRYLSVRSSQVSSIGVDALFGLANLETLDLEHNDLGLCKLHRSFPAGMFQHVPKLRHLFIGYNTVNSCSKCQVYSEQIDIFSSLPRLTNLSIDTLDHTLHLGQEFAQLTLLENITVVCNFVDNIINNSLSGLWKLPLQVLSLVNFQTGIQHFELGIFENLPHLIHLIVDDSHVGNHIILLALYPLANRNMESLYLRKTNGFATYSVPTVAFDDGIIGKDLTESLRSICLRHFSWVDSILFAFKPSSLTSGAWQDCINSIDLSRNKLENVGWVPALFEVRRLKLLNRLTISSAVTPLNEHYIHAFRHTYTLDYTHTSNGDQDTRPLRDQYSRPNVAATSNTILSEFNSQNDSHNDNIKEWTSVFNTEEDNNRTCDQNQHSQRILPSQEEQKSQFPYNGNITYYFPPSLRILKVINMIFDLITIGSLHIVCASNENLEELYWINNELTQAKGIIYGMEKLKVLDISGSIFDIADHLFDTFTGLEVFVLRDVKPDTFFKSISLQRLLRNLTNLRYIDVSNNRLNSLLFPPDAFTSTPNITHVILSQNRFSNIPFPLETTPNLRLLDLSENAILFLTEREQEALNRHVSRVEEFVLRLEGNAIACVCSQTSFMVWMLASPVTIQQSASLQCLSEDGSMFKTSNHEDMTLFCIICEGRWFLMAALILASLMVIAFMSAYLFMRFRTELQAMLMNIARWVRPLGPEHYTIGVFVGYADEDYSFVMRVLMKYLEDGCHMVTYIHQRDLLPGYRIQQFDQAITNSWRVLLVLSRSFLENYDMSQIVMLLACHSVTSMNRKRVFALVEKCQVQAIPNDLYGILDEGSIILFEDFNHQLNYEQQQHIKHCLRPA